MPNEVHEMTQKRSSNFANYPQFPGSLKNIQMFPPRYLRLSSDLNNQNNSGEYT